MMKLIIDAMERGFIPDSLVRSGIRRLCTDRLDSFRKLSPQQQTSQESAYLQKLASGPVAAYTEDANRQHYELPPAFFELILGKNLKYSSGYWPEGCTELDSSEEAALNETCQRAELADGQKILELGCGWGSLTLTMARRYPNARIVAISNSAPQRLFIEARAKNENLTNVTVLTRNMDQVISIDQEFGLFDRVVSVEMFEHMMNYDLLLRRISKWLKDDGKLFVHIFTHRQFAYPFETEGDDNWMGKYFFTGGQMPSHSLLRNFKNDLVVEQDWIWDGRHYAKTSLAWLRNMDRHREQLLTICADVYGEKEASRWFQRWRIFFMACEELFNYKNGSEWGVSHYRFIKRKATNVG